MGFYPPVHISEQEQELFLSFPDCQSLWARSAYITLGVASAFGPDHYILPHITQRIQAASAFQARPHYISYLGVVPTLSRLQIGGPYRGTGYNLRLLAVGGMHV